jgi:hypothetical protein
MPDRSHGLLAIAVGIFGTALIVSSAHAESGSGVDRTKNMGKKSSEGPDVGKSGDWSGPGDKTGNKGFIWFDQGARNQGVDKNIHMTAPPEPDKSRPQIK